LKYDVVVVGSGVGGYPAAVSLARKGLKVAVVEEHLLGGECTNYGCVPSKAFYHIGEAVRALRKVGGSVEVAWEDLVEWSSSIVESARRGVGYLLESYGVEVYNGRGVLKGKNRVLVQGGENLEIEGDKIVLALGTDPRPLTQAGFDGVRILSNREIFYLKEKPLSVSIIGGGVIGVETATMLANLGVQVNLLEKGSRVLSFLDQDVSVAVRNHLKQLGVKVVEGVSVSSVSKEGGGVRLRLSNGSEVESDILMVAIGRVPKTSGVNLENVGVELDSQGFIKVSTTLETSIPGIYAAGDVVGGPLLAHKAIVESLIVARNIMGAQKTNIDYKLVPLTIFTGLEVASIGFTEKELNDMGVKFVRYKMPLNYLSAVKIKDGSYSFIKILTSEDSRKIYGVHIVSPNASETISAFIPMALGKLLFEDVSDIPYPHLTVGEALREIALFILGDPVHIVVRK